MAMQRRIAEQQNSCGEMEFFQNLATFGLAGTPSR
jgi:hypothetical protein